MQGIELNVHVYQVVEVNMHVVRYKQKPMKQQQRARVQIPHTSALHIITISSQLKKYTFKTNSVTKESLQPQFEQESVLLKN